MHGKELGLVLISLVVDHLGKVKLIPFRGWVSGSDAVDVVKPVFHSQVRFGRVAQDATGDTVFSEIALGAILSVYAVRAIFNSIVGKLVALRGRKAAVIAVSQEHLLEVRVGQVKLPPLLSAPLLVLLKPVLDCSLNLVRGHRALHISLGELCAQDFAS